MKTQEINLVELEKRRCISERDAFYEQKERAIMPPRQWSRSDTKKLLTAPLSMLGDFLMLRRLKRIVAKMPEQLPLENVRNLAPFFIEAVMKKRAFTYDYLQSLGDLMMFNCAENFINQEKDPAKKTKDLARFYENAMTLHEQIVEFRQNRSQSFIQKYARENPKKMTEINIAERLVRAGILNSKPVPPSKESRGRYQRTDSVPIHQIVKDRQMRG